MLLSALDFPFCFAAVRYLGTDRIGRYEHVVVKWVKSAVPEGVREAWRERMHTGEEVGKVEGYAVVTGGEGVGVGVAGYDDHVRSTQEAVKDR